MRITVDGVEYISGREFNEEFCADPTSTDKWRCEGMPFIFGKDVGLPKGCTTYLYPVEACHAWFRGEL